MWREGGREALCPWKISISLDCGNLQNQCCTYRKLGQSVVVWLGCLAGSHQHTCGDHPGAWGMLANYLTSLPLCVTECLQAVWLLFWGFMFLSVVLFSSLTRFLVWSAQASPGYPAWLSVLPQTPSSWPPPQTSRALSSQEHQASCRLCCPGEQSLGTAPKQWTVIAARPKVVPLSLHILSYFSFQSEFPPLLPDLCPEYTRGRALQLLWPGGGRRGLLSRGWGVGGALVVEFFPTFCPVSRTWPRLLIWPGSHTLWASNHFLRCFTAPKSTHSTLESEGSWVGGHTPP